MRSQIQGTREGLRRGSSGFPLDARGSFQNRGSFAQSYSSTQGPLFTQPDLDGVDERVQELEDERDRLREEVERLRAAAQEGEVAQRELESITADLEARLEGRAETWLRQEGVMVERVSQLQRDLQAATEALQRERSAREGAQQQLMRVRQELYRAHQRKYSRPPQGASGGQAGSRAVTGDDAKRRAARAHVRPLSVEEVLGGSGAGERALSGSPGALPLSAATSPSSTVAKRQMEGGRAGYIRARREAVEHRRDCAVHDMLDFFGIE